MSELFGHVSPKHQITWFCRLCGSYEVRTPKTHLRDYHNTNYKRTQNKSYKDIIKCLFDEVY